MRRWKITVVLDLNEQHPRKWFAEALTENLQPNETIEELDMEFLGDIWYPDQKEA